tara:strand:+ start:495 stop:1418 length:924 start_codon:yes stop_codon:yes gene_type:complete
LLKDYRSRNYITINRIDTVKKLEAYLTLHDNTLTQTDSHGDTPLMIACERRRSQIALKILDLGADKCKLDHENNFAQTALMKACAWITTPDVVTKMLSFGKDKCKLYHKDTGGQTCLILACYNNHSDIALALLKVINNKEFITQVTTYGITALDYALKNNMTEVVAKIKELLTDKPKPTNTNQNNLFKEVMYNVLGRIIMEEYSKNPDYITYNPTMYEFLEICNKYQKNTQNETSQSYKSTAESSSQKTIDNLLNEITHKENTTDPKSTDIEPTSKPKTLTITLPENPPNQLVINIDNNDSYTITPR